MSERTRIMLDYKIKKFLILLEVIIVVVVVDVILTLKKNPVLFHCVLNPAK